MVNLKGNAELRFDASRSKWRTDATREIIFRGKG